jgi:hypothetical protein
MSIEKAFGMLKGRFKLLLKKVDIPLRWRLGDSLHMFA